MLFFQKVGGALDTCQSNVSQAALLSREKTCPVSRSAFCNLKSKIAAVGEKCVLNNVLNNLFVDKK